MNTFVTKNTFFKSDNWQSIHDISVTIDGVHFLLPKVGKEASISIRKNSNQDPDREIENSGKKQDPKLLLHSSYSF